VRLRDLGYPKDLVTRVSDHKPRTKRHLTVNSEVFINNKQVSFIDQMINIICDPLEM